MKLELLREFYNSVFFTVHKEVNKQGPEIILVTEYNITLHIHLQISQCPSFLE